VQFTITHLTGSRAGSTQQLQGAVITVGRDPSNMLAFDPSVDDKVSSFHANITVQGTQVLLTDLGSSNGTYFNGLKMGQPMPIISGANLQFGEGGPIVSLAFAAVGAPAPGAAAPAPGAAAPAPGAAPAVAGAAAAPAAAGAAPAGAAPGAAAPAGAAAPGAAAPGAAAPAGAAPAGAAPAAAGADPADEVAAAQAQAQADSDAAIAKAKADAKAQQPSKFRTLLIPIVFVGILSLVVVAGAVYMFRDKIPSGAQRWIRKIPGANKLLNPLNKVKSKVNRGKSTLNRGKRLTGGNKKKTPAKTEDPKDDAETPKDPDGE
jgi:hypothetical protein